MARAQLGRFAELGCVEAVLDLARARLGGSSAVPELSCLSWTVLDLSLAGLGWALLGQSSAGPELGRVWAGLR